MGLPSILEFNPKRIRPTLVPPMTPTGPIDGRVYTMYVSNVTSEYFIIISDRYCEESCTQLVRNDACAIWSRDCNGAFRLNLYVDLGDENNLIIFTRYIMYKELVNHYIHAIAYVERNFFKRNRFLYNSPVIVHFKSGCAKFNLTENYGTIRGYCNRFY